MRIMLLGVALVVLWSQVAYAAGGRSARLLLQSYHRGFDLQREIDLLVARGYVLFTGSWEDGVDLNDPLRGKRGIERILIRDPNSHVYRYVEQENTGGLSFPVEPPQRSRPLQLQAIAEGRKHEIADGDGSGTRQVVKVDNLLYSTYASQELSSEERQAESLTHYVLQGEDGSYPDTPADIYTLRLVTDARSVKLKTADNYSVYRGERDSSWIAAGNKRGKHIETITIRYVPKRDGYVATMARSHATDLEEDILLIKKESQGRIYVYRRTLDLDTDGETIRESLSVGFFERPIRENTRRVREIALYSDGVGSPGGPDSIVRISNKYDLQLNEAGNITGLLLSTDGDGNRSIQTLQLVSGLNRRWR